MVPDAAELALHYTQALKQVWKLHNLHGLSAAAYTQTADVETECNGLQTYDRSVMKIPPSQLIEVHLLPLARVAAYRIGPNQVRARCSAGF